MCVPRQRKRALGVSYVPYRQLVSWDGNYDDAIWCRSPMDRGSTSWRKRTSLPSMSPGSNYVLYFNEHDDNWYASGRATARTSDLTAKLGVKFQNETDDHPATSIPLRQAGWTEGDKSVLLYDRYDIWDVKPDGSGGRRSQMARPRTNRLPVPARRQAPPTVEEEGGPAVATRKTRQCPTTSPIDSFSRERAHKASGLYRVTLNSAAPPAKLLMLDKTFGVPIKARDADVYVFTISRFEEFPNLWVSSGAFTDMKKISDANPQQAAIQLGHVRADRLRQRRRQDVEGAS